MTGPASRGIWRPRADLTGARRPNFWSRHLSNFKVFRFILLCIFAVVMLFPVAWILSGSLKPLEQVFAIPVKWIPDPIQWRNYPEAWTSQNFNRNLINSLIVLTAQVSIQVFLPALAGYGFAKHNFPGKEIMFVIILGMSLLPLQITHDPAVRHCQAVGLDQHLPGAYPTDLCKRFRRLLHAPVHLLRSQRVHRRGAGRRGQGS